MVLLPSKKMPLRAGHFHSWASLVFLSFEKMLQRIGFWAVSLSCQSQLGALAWSGWERIKRSNEKVPRRRRPSLTHSPGQSKCETQHSERPECLVISQREKCYWSGKHSVHIPGKLTQSRAYTESLLWIRRWLRSLFTVSQGSTTYFPYLTLDNPEVSLPRMVSLLQPMPVSIQNIASYKKC